MPKTDLLDNENTLLVRSNTIKELFKLNLVAAGGSQNHLRGNHLADIQTHVFVVEVYNIRNKLNVYIT